MKIKFWGTAGSIPVANPKRSAYGGNTTCLRIESDCLPKGLALVIDAGSGFLPLSGALAKEGVDQLHILFTHWHHDHTQGLPLGPTTFMPQVANTLWGPVEKGVGGKQVIKTLMQPPFFPIDFNHRLVGSHFKFRDFTDPASEVIVIHPQGGIRMVKAGVLHHAETNGKMLSFGDEKKFDVREALVIRMIKSNHPEFTVSYRFEERSTGKVFVFLTDHENTDGLPMSLKGHLKDADLLVMDTQYKRVTYDERTAGYGHGTADYGVRVALTVGAKRLGLTHHDPFSTDADIDAIVKEGETALVRAVSGGGEGTISSNGGQNFVFGIKDYDEIVL